MIAKTKPTMILAALIAGTTLGASATVPTSTNYKIPWDVVGGGGGVSMSASYTLVDSVAQPSALGMSTSVSYILEPGFLAPPDFDEDGVRNFMDNCTQDANDDQRDTNADGFGNLCDADLDNNGITNAGDLGILKQRFFTADPDADLNGDGVVNFTDLGIMKQRFFTPPGPSGIAP